MESLSVFKLLIFCSCIGLILSKNSKSTTRQTDVQTDINELKRELKSLKQEVREIRKLKDDVQLVKETINNQGMSITAVLFFRLRDRKDSCFIFGGII